METVYLGLFSSLFKAIYDAILKPIIDFFGGLLNKLFTWIFENILKPLLIDVLLPLFKWLIELIYEILAGFLYAVLKELLHIIDIVQTVFNAFAGIEPVTYENNKYYLLELFFSNGDLQKATWIMIAIALALMMAFSIIAVMRSMADLSGEMKNPVGKVLRLTFEGFLKLIMIPILCIFLITLSGRILISVTDGISAVSAPVSEDGNTMGTKTTLARVIFCMTTLDAAKSGEYNVSSSKTAGITDGLRGAYYFSDYAGGSKDYYDSGQVSNDFNFAKMNFIVGFGVALIFLKILITCCFKFINRMFNVLLLYLSSPLFACSMPLDEGKNYNQWKDMFVGQLFSGYGAVVAMQLYLIIAPAILSGNIQFGGESTEGDLVIRMVFIIGGAFAIENAGSMITGMISSTAASMESAQEKEASGLMDAGMAIAKTAGNIMKSRFSGGKEKEGKEGAKGDLKKALSGEGKDGEGKDGEGNEGEGKEGGKEDGKESSNKFDGKKPGSAGSGAKFEGGKGSGSGSSGAQVTDSAKKMSEAKKSNKSNAPKPDTKGEADQDEEEEEGEAGGTEGTGGKSTNKSSGKTSDNKGGAAGAAKKKDKNVAGANRHKVTSSWMGGLLVLGRDKDGKRRFGINLGSKLNFGLKKDGTVSGNVFGIASWGKDKDGNTSRSILGGAFKWGRNADGTSNRSLLGGFSWKNDKDGNTTKVSVPFMRFKSVDDGSGNKVMKLSKVKIAQGLQFKRAFYTDETTGKLKTEMYCSEFSALSFAGMQIKQRYDADTKKIEKLATMTGDHFARVKDEKTGKVEYVKTHSDFLGRTKVYDRDKKGNYHVVATKGWISSESYLLNKETGETTLQKSALRGGFSLYEDTDAMNGIQPPKVKPSAPHIEPKGPTVSTLNAGAPNVGVPDPLNGAVPPAPGVNGPIQLQASGMAFSVQGGKAQPEAHVAPDLNNIQPGNAANVPNIQNTAAAIPNGPQVGAGPRVEIPNAPKSSDGPKVEIPAPGTIQSAAGIPVPGADIEAPGTNGAVNLQASGMAFSVQGGKAQPEAHVAPDLNSVQPGNIAGGQPVHTTNAQSVPDAASAIQNGAAGHSGAVQEGAAGIVKPTIQEIPTVEAGAKVEIPGAPQMGEGPKVEIPGAPQMSEGPKVEIPNAPTMQNIVQPNVIQQDIVQPNVVQKDVVQENIVQKDVVQENVIHRAGTVEIPGAPQMSEGPKVEIPNAPTMQNIVQPNVIQQDIVQPNVVQKDIVRENVVQKDVVQENIVQKDVMQGSNSNDSNPGSGDDGTDGNNGGGRGKFRVRKK